MAPQIFRQEASVAATRPDSLGRALSVTSPTSWLLLGTLIVGFGAAVGWSFLVRVPLTIAGQGVVLGADDRLTTSIVSESSGRLLQVMVKVGDRVRKGQVVARLSQEGLRQKIRLSRLKLASVQGKLARIRRLQAQSKAQEATVNAALRRDIRKTIKHMQRRLRWLRTKSEGERKLLQRGFMSNVQFAKSQAELAAAEESLAATRTKLKMLVAKETAAAAARSRELLNLKSEVAAAQRTLSDVQGEFTRTSRVTSRDDGIVSEIDASAGSMIEPGKPVIRLVQGSGRVRASADQAVVFVSLKDGGKVRPGMAAYLHLGSIRRSEFGSLRATVTRIDEIAASLPALRRLLNSNQLVKSVTAGGVVVAVHVRLTRKAGTPSGYAWTSGAGPNTKIGPGTYFTADITTERRRVAALVVPALR